MKTPVSGIHSFQHGERLNLHLGTRLTAIDEIVVVVPAEVLGAADRIGDVIRCDDDAGFRTVDDDNGKTTSLQVLLKPGMGLQVTKSCEVMVLSTSVAESPVAIEFSRIR